MIKIIQTGITTLDVDAIVNATNESLLGGGGLMVQSITQQDRDYSNILAELSA